MDPPPEQEKPQERQSGKQSIKEETSTSSLTSCTYYDASYNPSRDENDNNSGKCWVRSVMFDITKPTAFSLVPNAKVDGELEWRAELHVTTDDLPSLMRRGFHWSEENVVVEGGYILVEKSRLPPEFPAAGWTLARRYMMSDLSQPPLWQGDLCVFARSIKELSRFRISNLLVDNTQFMIATKARGQIVYNFNRPFPDVNFNAIYDSMPLQGWWPWPR